MMKLMTSLVAAPVTNTLNRFNGKLNDTDE